MLLYQTHCVIASHFTVFHSPAIQSEKTDGYSSQNGKGLSFHHCWVIIMHVAQFVFINGCWAEHSNALQRLLDYLYIICVLTLLPFLCSVFKQGRQPFLMQLLAVYKVFRPELVTLSVPSRMKVSVSILTGGNIILFTMDYIWHTYVHGFRLVSRTTIPPGKQLWVLSRKGTGLKLCLILVLVWSWKINLLPEKG